MATPPSAPGVTWADAQWRIASELRKLQSLQSSYPLAQLAQQLFVRTDVDAYLARRWVPSSGEYVPGGFGDPVRDAVLSFAQLPGESARAADGMRDVQEFANETTGDTHSLDEGKPAGAMLAWLVRAAYPGLALAEENPAEALHNALAHVGLKYGRTSSTVMASGLPLPCSACNERCRQPEVVAVPYGTLCDAILPALVAGRRDSEPIFVFENPTVLYSVVEHLKQARLSDTPPLLVCGAGYPSIATRTLLDGLAPASIYYSGDIDPSGLKIANWMARRYRERLKYWGISAAKYSAASLVTWPRRRFSDSEMADVRANTVLTPLAAAIEENNRFMANEESFRGQLVQDIAEFLVNGRM